MFVDGVCVLGTAAGAHECFNNAEVRTPVSSPSYSAARFSADQEKGTALVASPHLCITASASASVSADALTALHPAWPCLFLEELRCALGDSSVESERVCQGTAWEESCTPTPHRRCVFCETCCKRGCSAGHLEGIKSHWGFCWQGNGSSVKMHLYLVGLGIKSGVLSGAS